MNVPFAKPRLGPEEEAAAVRAIHSGWVTQGPEVEAFEREFAQLVGAPHACAVSSGTAALHLALKAAGVRPGDEVITVSHSFIATANAVRYCGATPVFVDVEPRTWNMDPALVGRVLSPRTRAILCVHQMGMPCDLEAIGSLARQAGVPLIEDAACATGSEIRRDGQWERIGRPHGDAACFSFHPRKLLTTGDGGMITTHRPEWDRQFRLWRHHGMNLPDSARHKASRIVFEEYEALGHNYRMTDIQAAVGREQLKRIPGFIEHRRKMGARYLRLLADIPGLVLPLEKEWARTNWQSFCVQLPAGSDQVEVMQRLMDAGVASRRGVMNAHEEPACGPDDWSCGCAKTECGCVPGTCARLQESQRAKTGCILLPMFSGLTEEQQDRVVQALGEAVANR